MQRRGLLSNAALCTPLVPSSSSTRKRGRWSKRAAPVTAVYLMLSHRRRGGALASDAQRARVHNAQAAHHSALSRAARTAQQAQQPRRCARHAAVANLHVFGDETDAFFARVRSGVRQSRAARDYPNTHDTRVAAAAARFCPAPLANPSWWSNTHTQQKL